MKVQQTRRRKWIRLILLYVLLPYVIVVSLAFILQRRLMYFPTVEANLAVDACGLSESGFTDVQIRAADGVRIKGWLLRNPKQVTLSPASSDDDSSRVDRPALLIYFPGNAGNRLVRLDEMRSFATAGFDVLIFDYRGYGDSEGSPAEPDLESDAKQIYRYARDELKYEESRMVLFGESLGGGVALSLWSETDRFSPRPAAVVLKSTFTSMVDAARFHYPWLPIKLLLLDRWSSMDRIKHVPSPIVVIHGTNDEVVPFSHAQQFQSATHQVTLIEHRGGMHNDMPHDLILVELRKLRSEMDQ